MKGALLALPALILGCAPSKPPAYVEARAAAERNYAYGRYGEAARNWSQAARSAEASSDREEALYRVATSRERSGDIDGSKAAYQELLRAFPKGSRAARAAYELATFELDEKNDALALQLYVEVMEQYPDSGLAGRALDRCLQGILAEADVERKLQFLAGLSRLEHPEIAEKVAYARARLLYEHDRLEEAKREFLRVAKDYPYPQGAYWDDALWYAADSERRLQHPAAALSLLQQMLREREPAHFQGSYQRPRYAQAQYRIAEIYRDDLEQPERAMHAFRKVFTDHPTSLLRDDALWQEARIARAHGMESAACEAVRELVGSLPESRYASCARLMCREANVARGRPCRHYIERDLAAPENGEVQSSK